MNNFIKLFEDLKVNFKLKIHLNIRIIYQLCSLLNRKFENNPSLGHGINTGMLCDDRLFVIFIAVIFRTPLMLAVMNGHRDAVLLLLEQGANPNSVDINQRTAAHCGVRGLLQPVINVYLTYLYVYLSKRD